MFDSEKFNFVFFSQTLRGSSSDVWIMGCMTLAAAVVGAVLSWLALNAQERTRERKSELLEYLACRKHIQDSAVFIMNVKSTLCAGFPNGQVPDHGDIWTLLPPVHFNSQTQHSLSPLQYASLVKNSTKLYENIEIFFHQCRAVESQFEHYKRSHDRVFSRIFGVRDEACGKPYNLTPETHPLIFIEIRALEGYFRGLVSSLVDYETNAHSLFCNFNELGREKFGSKWPPDP